MASPVLNRRADTALVDDFAHEDVEGRAKSHYPIDGCHGCGDYLCMKKPLRIRLPFGTLKVASYLQLSV